MAVYWRLRALLYLAIAALTPVSWALEVTQSGEPSLALTAEAAPETPEVFGQWIFDGEFANESFSGFNPGYVIGIGDRIVLQLWGGYEYQAVLTVDPQGNIFVPKVGPVSVLNVRNSELNKRLEGHVKKVYQRNVGVYATLETAQPVKVYVTGFVRQPGLYAGLSSDSVLHYLDKAGGINPRSGSFVDISVLRGGEPYRQVNLYDFLLRGQLPAIQLLDGDTLLVHPRMQSAQVSGLVQSRFQFEFASDSISLSELATMAQPLPQATHVRIVRSQGRMRSVEYYPLEQAAELLINNGDRVEFIADKKLATFTVRIEGEHDSQQEYVVPYGTELGDVLAQVSFNARSDKAAIQLLRDSVRERQKAMLDSSLRALESTLLTARSSTNEEASLRSQEAKLILQWVERARNIEPRGQVVLLDSEYADDIVLEPGDVIRIPKKSNLILVHGEVLTPNAAVFSPRHSALHYIEQAGGFNQSAKQSRVLLLHRNGSYSEISPRRLSRTYVEPGDEILVLPKISVKSVQVAKDFTQILYQIAVAAGVVLRL